MSDTPKTDAAEYTSTEFVGDGNYVVRSSFARQLERRIKELEEELFGIKHEAWRLVQVLNAYDGSGIPHSDASDAFLFLRKVGVERTLRGEKR